MPRVFRKYNSFWASVQVLAPPISKNNICESDLYSETQHPVTHEKRVKYQESVFRRFLRGFARACCTLRRGIDPRVSAVLTVSLNPFLTQKYSARSISLERQVPYFKFGCLVLSAHTISSFARRKMVDGKRFANCKPF